MSRPHFVPASILGALIAATTTLAATVGSTAAQAADEAARAALPARAVAVDDPVALGFGRMLAHTPNTAAPKVPAGLGEDPLLAAVVWTLHGVAVASHHEVPAPQALAR